MTSDKRFTLMLGGACQEGSEHFVLKVDVWRLPEAFSSILKRFVLGLLVASWILKAWVQQQLDFRFVALCWCHVVLYVNGNFSQLYTNVRFLFIWSSPKLWWLDLVWGEMPQIWWRHQEWKWFVCALCQRVNDDKGQGCFYMKTSQLQNINAQF